MSSLELGPIDHVGVLVDDLAQAKRFYTDLGWVVDRETHSDDLGLDAAFLRPAAGGSMVELIELTVPGRRTSIVLNEALGLDHIAIRVGDIVAALAQTGVETTTDVLDLGGRRTVFTRPESTGGVVYQLVEAAQ